METKKILKKATEAVCVVVIMVGVLLACSEPSDPSNFNVTGNFIGLALMYAGGWTINKFNLFEDNEK